MEKETYCLACRKYTKILSKLGIKTPLSKVPLLNILF